MDFAKFFYKLSNQIKLLWCGTTVTGPVTCATTAHDENHIKKLEYPGMLFPNLQFLHYHNRP